MPANKKAMALASLLLTRGGYSYERSIPRTQVNGLKLLTELKAVVPGPFDSRYASCSFCGLHRGPVFRCDGEMHVQCPDCGPYKVDLSEQRNWAIDAEWMIRKLRAALNKGVIFYFLNMDGVGAVIPDCRHRSATFSKKFGDVSGCTTTVSIVDRSIGGA